MKEKLILRNIDPSQSYGKCTFKAAAGVSELLHDAVFFSQEDDERGWLLSHRFRQLLKNVLYL